MMTYTCFDVTNTKDTEVFDSIVNKCQDCHPLSDEERSKYESILKLNNTCSGEFGIYVRGVEKPDVIINDFELNGLYYIEVLQTEDDPDCLKIFNEISEYVGKYLKDNNRRVEYERIRG